MSYLFDLNRFVRFLSQVLSLLASEVALAGEKSPKSIQIKQILFFSYFLFVIF